MPRSTAVLLALALVLAPAGARAQLEGAAHLETGFVPDPAMFEGHTRGLRAVGEVVAAEQRAACRGFVDGQPSHVIQLDTRFGFMRIFATGPRDLVLAVRVNDHWMCSGDRFGPHPSVEGVFERGRMEIWVGLETAGGDSDYHLRITETRSIRPGVGADDDPDESVALARDLGLAVEASAGAHGETRLRRGFLPDPRTIEGAAGGPLDASGLGGTCRGRITEQPTHIVTLVDDHDFLQLYLEAQGELTLVVLTPEGRFLCDAGTRDVVEVSSGRWPAGDYRVWVGTVQEDVRVRHRLAISEIRRVR